MQIVFVNRVPQDTSVLGGNAAAVVSDENQSGGYQGQFLADYFNAKGQTDVRYIMLQGTLGLVHTEQRSASVIQAMKDGGLNPIEAAAPAGRRIQPCGCDGYDLPAAGHDRI